MLPLDPRSVRPEYSDNRLERWLLQAEALPPEGTRFVALSELGKGLTLAAAHARTTRPMLVVFSRKSEARDTIEHFSLLAGRAEGERAHYLPSGEFDYYRGLLPNPEVLCERNVALFHALNDPSARLFVTTVSALLQKVVPPAEYLAATRIISPNDEVLRDDLVHGLLEAGYQRQPTVYDPGVFSVRGGVIDVFSPLYPKPVRIEFFGDLVDEIRFFDPGTQLSEDKVGKAFLIPVGQTLLPRGESYNEAAGKVKDRLDHQGIPKARRDEILEKIQEGIHSQELSLLFPLLSRGSASILDYFPQDTLIFWDGKEIIREMARDHEIPKLHKSHELYEKEPHPIAAFDELFVSPEALEGLIGRPGYGFESFASKEIATHLLLPSEETGIAAAEGAGKGSGHPPLATFVRRFREWMEMGYRVHIVCHTRTHAERIRMLFVPYDIPSEIHGEGERGFPAMLTADFSKLHLWQGYVNEARVFPGLRAVILSEEALFGKKRRVGKSSAWVSGSDSGRLLSSFRDLKVNDFVVHKDHGIGKYLGLKSMDFSGQPNDYVLLEYKDGDKLYVPVYRLNVLQKYVGGDGASASLDKLGGDRWAKAKSKAERAVAELAAEFLNIQARRKLVPAYRFSDPGPEYGQFEMEFPFDETPDQLKTVQEVMADMSRSHPIDRLICGDVGYGKTEIAMRAAYRAVLDKKQVAILVPTTVLAFQHFETFTERFKSTGARVEMVSRLRHAADTKKILGEVKEGKIDVLIGTHRLLSSDIVFKDLGLIIVDEEHRFGVVHKEKLKKMSESVHFVSMTATPIPRTLNMAMTGIKDISVITTPPPDRLAVRTFVCRRAEEVIVEAITNEVAREGQVFFVHNRIESIFGIADDLKRLLPKVSVEVVHGQMDGDTLEKKMLAFYHGEAQVLLTTAIIESGLDIPRANTIIIDRADHFGLAQLYQLRGRVGRSAKRAYCYLLVPPENQMTTDAKQRLQVIQRYTDLGSGFSVASHDLEIRGAGDLLGKDQSGHLTAVGIDMYFELLEDSIRALQGEEKRPEIEPEITMKIGAYFPSDYLPDIGEKVTLYRRLSSVESEEAVSVIEVEIRDRFGAPPEEVLNLLGLMTLKLFLKRLHVVRMSCGPKRTSLQFAPSTPASPEKLVRLIQKGKGRYSMTPDQKLVFTVDSTDWKSQLQEIRQLCDELGVDAS